MNCLNTYLCSPFIAFRFSVLGLLAVILNWSLVSIYLVGAVVSFFFILKLHELCSHMWNVFIADHDESA